MNAGQIIIMVFVPWFIVAAFGIKFWFDTKHGLIPNGKHDRYGTTYYPPEDVPVSTWVMTVLWPITLVMMVPLGVWIAIKWVGQFFVGVFKIYKDKV